MFLIPKIDFYFFFKSEFEMGSFIHGGKLELVTELQGKSYFLLALTCSKASVSSESLIFNLFLPISDVSSVTLTGAGAISQGIGMEVVHILELRRTAVGSRAPE